MPQQTAINSGPLILPSLPALASLSIQSDQLTKLECTTYGYAQIQESHIKEHIDNIQGHQLNKHETRACNDSVFSPLEKVAPTMQSGPPINSGNFILPPYNGSVKKHVL